MKKLGTLVLFLSLCPLLFGQGEASNWYFGRGAGLRFNNDGSVTPLSDGKLDTFEGCATISDNFGNLLFYTDGITVYDQNNNLMPNGRGLFGDPSSTQSALIVPVPLNADLFYIFTVDTSTGPGDPDFGFNYSIVDMSLNGGLGEVVEKNTNLLKDCSEKISAVLKDCSDNSVWVLTLGPENGESGPFNTYYAYEVNSAGIDPNPVKTVFPSLAIEDPRGYLKLSSDGTKMISANVLDGAQIYDFDAATGVVSNQHKLLINATNKFPYGAEFSPNGELLYLVTSNNILDKLGNTSNLLQYDLLSDNISASEVVLDQSPTYRGALQLGNNGKIYRTISSGYFFGTPYLGVIDNPNVRGTDSDYLHNEILLEGLATQGLPPFIQSFFSKIPLAVNSDGSRSSTLNGCLGESIRLEAEEIPGATYLWSKDGYPIDLSTTYFLEILDPTEEDSGKYGLEIIPVNSNECHIQGEALVNVLGRPDPLINLSVCDIDSENSSDGLTRINLARLNQDPEMQFAFYESLIDRTNDNPISDATNFYNTSAFNQTLYYRSINAAACEYLGEVVIEVSSVTKQDSSHGPFYSCDEISDDNMLLSTFDLNEIAAYYQNESIIFYASLEDLANDENELREEYVSEPTFIYALRTLDNSCLGIDIIELDISKSPNLEMPEEFFLCENIDLIIEGPEGFINYNWYIVKNGQEILVSENETATINQEGNYILDTVFSLNKNGEEILCENSTTFSVIPSGKAVLQEIAVNDFSSNNTIQIDVTGIGDYEYSIDGINYQSGNVFREVQPGYYHISIRDLNGCGIVEKEIAVMGYPAFFTPNGDGINDFWKITGLNEQFESNAMIAIFDRYGRIITQLSPTASGWDGRFNNRELPASDYWFTIKLENGRQINGHFALKR